MSRRGRVAIADVGPSAPQEHSLRNTAVVEHRPVLLLPIDRIDSSPLNPRKRFGDEALQELAASLEADGLLQPIVVTPTRDSRGRYLAEEDAAHLRYTIVAGERRWRAAKLLGWSDIPASVREDVDDATHLRLALLENLARTDLDPLEEAEGYRQLNELGMTQAEIAAAVHRSQPAVANAIRLLKAPQAVQDKLQAGAISPSHVLALLKYEAFPEVLVKVAEIAAERHTTTKELEKPLGWEFTNALHEAKLSVQVNSAVFDWQRVCKKCPFGAFQAENYGGQCFKPDHFRELQKEQRAKDKAKADKELEKAGQGGKGALKLSSLKYGQYERIYGQVPAGCSEACECRRAALEYGGQTVQVCVKPAHYKQLVGQQRQREDERRKAKVADLQQRCGERLDAVGEVGSRELALLAVDALGQSRDDKQLGRILAKHAPGFKPKGKRDLDDLAALEPLQLVKIAVEALLGNDISELGRWEGAKAEYADWYAGGANKPKHSKKAAAVGQQTDDSAEALGCTRCGADDHATRFCIQGAAFDPDDHLADEIAADAERLERESELAVLVGAVS